MTMDDKENAGMQSKHQYGIGGGARYWNTFLAPKPKRTSKQNQNQQKSQAETRAEDLCSHPAPISSATPLKERLGYLPLNRKANLHSSHEGHPWVS